MTVTKCWITGRPNQSGYLASVTMEIQFQGGFSFQFRGMRLIETKEKKVVLCMPDVRDGKGVWHPTICTLNPLTRDALEKAALSAWYKTFPGGGDTFKEMLEPL